MVIVATLHLKKGGPSVQAKLARERAQGLEFIKTFVRVARPILGFFCLALAAA